MMRRIGRVGYAASAAAARVGASMSRTNRDTKIFTDAFKIKSTQDIQDIQGGVTELFIPFVLSVLFFSWFYQASPPRTRGTQKEGAGKLYRGGREGNIVNSTPSPPRQRQG